VKPRQGLGSVSDQLLQLTGLAVHLRSPLRIGAEKSIQASQAFSPAGEAIGQNRMDLRFQ